MVLEQRVLLPAVIHHEDWLEGLSMLVALLTKSVNLVSFAAELIVLVRNKLRIRIVLSITVEHVLLYQRKLLLKILKAQPNRRKLLHVRKSLRAVSPI